MRNQPRWDGDQQHQRASKSCRSAACIAASSHATDGSIVSKKESIRAETIIIADE